MFMKLNVLIIEDESIVSLHIKKIVLMAKHYVINVVKNANDALEVAKTSNIDLIISDININGNIDGIECCKILQKKYDIPIIFITAYRDIDTLNKASDIDFIGYLVKPFREDELETMLNLTVIKYTKVSTKIHKISQDYTFNYKENKLFYKNTPIDLTKKESKFLRTLLNAKGNVVSHDIIDDYVWESEPVYDSTRRALVHRFKQKLPNFPLELIKGKGYKIKHETL